MPGTSLLALIDDIASLLDDIGAQTKIAAKATAGVLGDDLALNAEQVSGVRAERELPVVWAVAKGSALNKLILVPTALALSYFVPWLITPLLMLGGAYLSYEGFEKVLHAFAKKPPPGEQLNRLRETSDPVGLEKDKIRGAIRTDFILSAEIVVIALGTAQEQPFLTQALVVTAIATVLTVGVYTLVAAIVKLDDLGIYLQAEGEGAKRALGASILWCAPRLLRALSVVGTIAMFLVGGGIVVHGLAPLSRLVHGAAHAVHTLPSLGSIFAAVVPALLNGVTGIVLGAALVGAHHLISALRSAHRRPQP